MLITPERSGGPGAPSGGARGTKEPWPVTPEIAPQAEFAFVVFGGG